MLTPWLFGWPEPPTLLAVLLLALALDLAVGDPAWLYRRVPHPVVLIGRLTELGERRLYRPDLGRAAALRRGLVLVIVVVATAGGLGWALARGLAELPGGWIVEALLVSTLIALRGLLDRVRAVARALRRDLESARAEVAHLVGRDPQALDGPGVARAAAESLAENFSDGAAAPAFWFLLLGLPGLCAYKAVNTLDSMIGHRSARYEAFGKAAARLDDALNWVPARLAGTLLVLAALVVPGARAIAAWRIMRRDAPRHRSPNAGWPEAALAGALGVRLAGPRVYAAGPVDDHWMGEGRTALGPDDLAVALGLTLAAHGLLVLLVAAGWALA